MQTLRIGATGDNVDFDIRFPLVEIRGRDNLARVQ